MIQEKGEINVLYWMITPHSLIALATLTGLEIVLGVDNIIFISILTSRLLFCYSVFSLRRNAQLKSPHERGCASETAKAL